MKKQTKQSRKTRLRKDKQARVRQRAETLMANWLRTGEGRRAAQLRQAALIGALQRQFGAGA